MKRALIVGIGGIGQVYIEQAKRLGHKVITVDNKLKADFKSVDDFCKSDRNADYAVLATPNFTHLPLATKLADCKQIKMIVVEKPGFPNVSLWTAFYVTYPKTKLFLAKNNLFRSEIDMFDCLPFEDIESVNIVWLNKSRIPNPGSWFTNKKLAFGGVGHDLVPHLYCFAIATGVELNNIEHFEIHKTQDWNLDTCGATDYGVVVKDGIYDVEDHIQLGFYWNKIHYQLEADWKNDEEDKQCMTINFKDGHTIDYNFGLCPNVAYGNMIETYLTMTDLGYKHHKIVDTKIHELLKHD